MTSQINVTPFVDVCLVLLIIFMVVTPMVEASTNITLPTTESPEKTEEEGQIVISVKDGIAYFSGNAVREEDLVRALEEKFEENPGTQIAVKGDKFGKYGDVMAVLRAAREVGFERIGLVTEPEDRAAAMRRITEEEAGVQ
ncbi:MAG: biopolymer transporter ExbD [Acidobacteria bacterium]|nr:biopolymer transporter ExbD [Acidobacteriota bacterium]